MSRCRVLKQINFKDAPFLEKVHVSQCPRFDEEDLLTGIQRLPTNRSKFVSLRPLHEVSNGLSYLKGQASTISFTDCPT